MKKIILKQNEPFKESLKVVFRHYINGVPLLKESEEKLNELLINKNYNEIFKLYGKKIYLFYTPKKNQESDLKLLIKKGLFEDIYTKYGETVYNKCISKMKALDIYNETGNKSKKIFSRIKTSILKKFLAGTLATSLLLPAGTHALLIFCFDKIIKDNSEIYSEEIETYDRQIKTYGQQVKELQLTDIQTIMKVMDDIWNYVDGYGNPTNDIPGYGRLTFSGENKMGVCRNLADEFTTRINAIDLKYNARNLVVNLDSNCEFYISNINRVFQKNENSATTVPTPSFNMQSIFGNHMVTMLDIPYENLTLIIDTTNPSIGVFRAGEIYMFATENGKGITTPYLNQVTAGIDSQMKYTISVMQSYFKNNEDMDTLKQRWGIEAQNKALNQVRNINKTHEEKKLYDQIRNNIFLDNNLENLNFKNFEEENVEVEEIARRTR